MKPAIPKGTRDFSPVQVIKRNYIFDTIRKVFIKYGYQPIETPAMEKLTTLMGKYGDEGDKLLFKVLNNGDFLNKSDATAFAEKNTTAFTHSVSKRGLRYDLTVPFARYVVMHQNDITFPFKRYQIQPVWRADRPQKGRYQEFYQCDADVVGSGSLMLEAELAQIYDEVFADLGINVTIKINNRKILFGMAEAAGIKDQFMDMTVAIDKLDKIGLPGVIKELSNRGIGNDAIQKIETMLSVVSLEPLKTLLADSETGMKGVAELEKFHRYFDTKPATNTVEFDITLARGLSYYTGCIFEVKANDVEMGSIGGGGRYDDLTSNFGLKGVSGVGISFGAARIFDVMETLNLYPESLSSQLDILLVAFDNASHEFAFKCLNQLRTAGIAAELYPEPTKMNKQMKYANARNVPYVGIIGSEEVTAGVISLKNIIRSAIYNRQ